MMDAAQVVLTRRPSWGTLLGVPLVAAVGALVAWLAAGAVGLPLPGWIALLGSAALFTALEVGVRRAGASRAGPARALLGALVRRLGEAGEPRAGWRQGLPYLRGRVDGHDVVFSFEAAAGEGLRVTVQVDAEPPAQLWLVGRQPEDFPQRWLDKLSARSVVQPVEDTPDGVVALSVDPEPAAALLKSPAFVEVALDLVALNAPTSATFDLQPDGLGWDTLLTPRVDADLLLTVARRMTGLGWAPAPPSGLPDDAPPVQPPET